MSFPVRAAAQIAAERGLARLGAGDSAQYARADLSDVCLSRVECSDGSEFDAGDFSTIRGQVC